MQQTEINFPQRDQQAINFPSDYPSIWQRVEFFEPKHYGKSRNYIDGKISYLSPYISRGVISTRRVYEHLKFMGYKWWECEKFIQELAWRDYWQLLWKHKGDAINSDLKHPQPEVNFNKGVPERLVSCNTEIEAIDRAVRVLEETGYMHNHVRMYSAALACNVGRYHWLESAQWMYYHLLDGDWASNSLSWQWVAGSNSSKKYFANQENINKYCHTNDRDTIVDRSYESLTNDDSSDFFATSRSLELTTKLPEKSAISINFGKPTFLYNSYNIDPEWHVGIDANRILVLEPSHFEKYPVSNKVINFILALTDNIKDIQIYVGELTELEDLWTFSNVFYKEHPLNKHYPGVPESRGWLSDTFTQEPKSFFSFWKKITKDLRFE